MTKLLVVEDDKELREALATSLTQEGYELATSSSADDAIAKSRTFHPDVILLDIGLPDRSGYEVCRMIRKSPENDQTTIVMLSGMGSETEIVHGLELGADDYIVKPCTPSILSARLRAVLRRKPKLNQEQTPGLLQVHGLSIDPNRHRVSHKDLEIQVTPSEFKILYFLASRPGWVFTRTQIVQSIKQQDFAISERSIDVQMFSLRKRLGELESLIETVRGVGYRMKDAN